MSVQITHSERRPFKSDDPFRGSPEELEELTDAFDAYFGYFGRDTVDENAATVTHHIEGASHPNYVGSVSPYDTSLTRQPRAPERP